ncbi:hypothetical protein KUTeg_021374, partial [Tegillarca granosa]
MKTLISNYYNIFKRMIMLSDSSGMLQFSFEKAGNITKDDFDSNDVFIFDTKVHIFVWIGKRTSVDERKNALGYAH